MSRHPRRRAARGSEKWLQLAVNDRPDVLDRALENHVATPIRWVSPVAADEYAEYRDQEALDRLGVTPSTVPLTEFWPRRGPQWDALGLATDGTAVLVEAKAHVAELVSGPGQAGPAALPRIAAALDAAKRWYGAEGADSWNGVYYQYANRLAHLYFFRELNRIPATLVFLYFCGDHDMGGPVDRAAWASELSLVHERLGLRTQPDGVVEAFAYVGEISSADG